MFVLKKIIGALLSPGVIILVLLGLGLLRIITGKNSKQCSRFLFFLAFLSFYFFTTAPLPQALLYPLENQYKPFQQVNDIGKIDYIVVLSGGRVREFKGSAYQPTHGNHGTASCRGNSTVSLILRPTHTDNVRGG